jgi:hypothetical protein
VSAYRRIGVGLGKIAKFLTQMGAAAGRRGAVKKHGRLKIVLVLVVVLVLDLLGLCVETRPESSRTISFH